MTTVRNGRVPAIIDHTNNDKVVWESGAILLYLAERFNKIDEYVGKDLNERAQVWEWLFFQVSSVVVDAFGDQGLSPFLGLWAWTKSGTSELVPPHA